VLKTYHHIFFDLDHTLWDFESNSKSTLFDIFNQYQSKFPSIPSYEVFEKQYHIHNDFYWEEFNKSRITRDELRRIRFLKTLEDFNIYDEALAIHLAEVYLNILPTKKAIMTEAHDVLDYLKKKYDLHIITNGFDEIQHKKLSNASLDNYFHHIITSEKSGSKKPNKEIFKYAFYVTGATVLDSIFIGDSIEADINGAKSVGMDYVFFNPKKTKHTEKIMIEISELRELKKIL
jgi:putative hydrolase of the HAD superfamily